MNQETLHLWCAYPDDLLDEEAAQACARLLSDEERARWKRFKFEKHRREYLATHALVRTALSQYRALPPELWRFVPNEYGKPAIHPDCALRFNLSNSLGLVVCLIGEGADVGVDVESRERAETMMEVAPRVFSPRELAQLDALNGDGKLERALHLWTLKEAYIKARGMGLALPLDKFSFLFDERGSIRLEMDASLNDTPQRWQFCLLEHARHCIALMIEETSALDLHVWEARPPCATSQKLEFAGAIWYPES